MTSRTSQFPGSNLGPSPAAGSKKLVSLLQRSGLHALLQQSPWPALVYDHRRAIVYLNPAGEKYYDYRQEELLGVTTRVLLGTTISRQLFQEVANRLYGECAPYLGPLPQRRRDGRQEERFAAVFPLQADSRLRPVAYVCSYCSPGEATAMLGWLLGGKLNARFGQESRSLTAALEPEPRQASRQEEIIRMLALDYSAKEIASLLNISPSTVRVVRWKHRHAQETVKQPAKIRSQAQRPPTSRAAK